MTFLVLDHVRKEGLSCVIVRNDVDVEELLKPLRSRLKDSVGVRNTSIVDENGWRSKGFPDSLSSRVDCLEICDVALEEVYIFNYRWSLGGLMARNATQNSHLYVGSTMSKTATFIPLEAKLLTVNSPIPFAPPVMTTTSLSHPSAPKAVALPRPPFLQTQLFLASSDNHVLI
jgi:hypothetical protein